MSAKAWWEIYPGRLEHEFRALESKGITYQRDEYAFAKGILRLELKVPTSEHVLSLEAVFPDLYPYFRFEVRGTDIELAHHINPFSKNLCLMGQATSNWVPSYTLAEVLDERLGKVIQAGRSDNAAEVTGLEEHQAEPISNYYSYAVGPAVIVDGGWSIKPCFKSGYMLIGLSSSGPALRGAVFEVRDETGRIITESDIRVRNAFAAGCIRGRWIRLTEAPKHEKAPELFNYLLQKDKGCTGIKGPVNGGTIEVRAALFPEERSWRKSGDGWVFVYKYETSRVVQSTSRKSRPNGRRNNRRGW